MKNIVLSGVVATLLLFSGCSNTKPAVDKKATEKPAVEAQEVKAVETETVASEDSTVNSSSATSSSDSNLSMADIESELSPIYFNFDQYNIDSDMQSKIEKASEVAKSTASDYNIKLEGNCDEWGSDEYNFALGLKRADTVKKAIVAQGIDASRISMVSYGESNPVCTDQTQACWAKNRRVDFKLLP
jgi:peptidoglycan-associated lipoprotein